MNIYKIFYSVKKSVGEGGIMAEKTTVVAESAVEAIGKLFRNDNNVKRVIELKLEFKDTVV